jgi:hypothetical protein
MPISFQSPDYIGQAMQNLGESLTQIQAAKNAEKQKTIDQYMKLVDVSLEGVRSNFRGEVLGDLETFKKEAADFYVKAEQENRIPNYKELTTIEDKKKVLLSKVAKSQLLEEAFKQSMVKAMDLRSKNKLAPESMDALNKWSTTKTKIDDTPDPRMLIEEQYTPSDIQKLEITEFGNARKIAEKTFKWTRGADGNFYQMKDYTPEEVKRDAEALWESDPMLQKFYQRNGISKDKYIEQRMLTEATAGENMKQPSQGRAPSVRPDVKNWKPNYDLSTPNRVIFDATNQAPILLPRDLLGIDGKVVAKAGDYFLPGEANKSDQSVSGSIYKKAQMIPYTDPTTKTTTMIAGPNAPNTPIKASYRDFRPIISQVYGRPDPQTPGKADISDIDAQIGYVDSKQISPNSIRKYEYDGDVYSYDELIAAGVDVALKIKEGLIKIKK